MRRNRSATRLAISCLLATSLGGAAATESEWIWSEGNRHGTESVEFVCVFEAEKDDLERAALDLAADFCRCEAELNGTVVASVEPYDDHVQVDVRRYLKAGANALRLVARGVEGPSAVAFRIAPIVESSAASTTAHGKPVRAFGPLRSLGWPNREAVRAITPFDEYNQWKEAKGAEERAKAVFSELPDGFEIDLVRVARDGEDSWVSLAIDPSGRLIVAREKKGLLRMTLAEDGKSVTTVETIDEVLRECRGLLFAHGSLFASANNSKALYRLRDTNGDGAFDERRQLFATTGGVGHGRNDLALGPDGMIYAIHGDSVDIPDSATNLTPPVVRKTRQEGHLVRTDAEGKRRVIVCAGLRNPFGIDFNADGEAFTYDADNESDMELPFYRPTRVNHLVPGADYGWRKNAGSWPVYAPDSLPTTFDVGKGSPTAVKFGTRSHFPPRFREALFILDWAYGRILAVRPVATGASYTCRAETFLRGRPLNVTDLDFGPDGAMYFVTGGRQTRSALYRVRFTGAAAEPREPTRQEEARRAFSKGARDRRRELERGAHPDRAWASMDDADPWIRHAARVAIERRPVAEWKTRALEENDAGKAAFALLALARVGPEEALPQVLSKVAGLPFAPMSRDEKLAVLRTCDVGAGRGARLPDEIHGQVESAFPCGIPSLDRELAELLVALKRAEAIPRMLSLLAAVEDQPQQLFYLDALSKAEAGWTMAHRETFFRALQRARAFNGDKSLPGFIDRIRKRAIGGLGDEERRELADLTDWKRKVDPLPPPRKVVKHWNVEDLIAVPERQPDRERGARMFEAALCAHCHQIGARGTPVGPNLTGVGNRFSRRDMLEAIIEPSNVVSEAFRNHVVTKRDGSAVIGRVVRNDFRKSIITLAPNAFDPWEFVEMRKGDVAKFEESAVSPMPPGLLDTLTREEIEDLLGFLDAGGVDHDDVDQEDEERAVSE